MINRPLRLGAWQIRQYQRGFTLVEIMIVVVIMTILAVIATASYSRYAIRAATSAAQQEMLKLSTELERHQSRNFTYKGFDLANHYPAAQVNTATQTLALNQIHYELSVVDADTAHPVLTATSSKGRGWAIKATSAHPRYPAILLTSSGIRCTNALSARVSYASCDTEANGAAVW